MTKNLLICSMLGLLVAAFMMNAAWQHNPQGEIHSDGAIDWSYWLLIGLSWFLPVFIVSGFLGLLVIQFLRQDMTNNRRAEKAVAPNRSLLPSQNSMSPVRGSED